MPQAANVITFPVNSGSSGFLGELSGSAEYKLDAIATRLSMIAAAVYYISTSDDLDQITRNMVAGIGQSLRDCIDIADITPIGESA